MNVSNNDLFITINSLKTDSKFIIIIDNNEMSINFYQPYGIPKLIQKNIYNLYKVNKSPLAYKFNQV